MTGLEVVVVILLVLAVILAGLAAFGFVSPSPRLNYGWAALFLYLLVVLLTHPGLLHLR